MKNRNSFILVVLIAIGGVLLVEKANRRQRRTDENHPPTATRQTERLAALGGSEPPARGQPASLEPGKSEFKLESESREFTRFRAGRRVALPSASQQAELGNLLKSESLIQESVRILRGEDTYLMSDEADERRMAAVDFLGKALLWQENPARDTAKRAALEIIRRNLDEVERPRSLKRMLAGDQIELYQYLLRSDRAEAIQLFERERDTSAGALMAYTINFESELIASRR